MSDGVVYIITITLLVALGGLAIWIAQQTLGGSGMKLFQNKNKRTGVVEATSVDGRRRLLLIRRDDVEHLVMTGGPVDLVIETGIDARPVMPNGMGEMLSRADQGMDGGSQMFSDEDDPLTLRANQSN